MKVRLSFVTNSSSSSFTVFKKLLTQEQIRKLLEWDGGLDEWNIWEDDVAIYGETIMNNGDIDNFLDELNVDKRYFVFDDY